MYLETASLPFKYNFIAFDSHNIMVNFLLHEQRLSRQQCHAITLLLLPNDIPGANMLTYLPNVEKVYLGSEHPIKLQGWYRVIRSDGKKPKLENPHGHLIEV